MTLISVSCVALKIRHF